MQLIVITENAILNDNRQIVPAPWQRQCLLLVVTDHEQSGQSEIHLFGRIRVRVRVVPIGAGSVLDVKFVAVAGPRMNREARMPIHGFGHMQAVPVYGAGLVERIDEMNAYALTAMQPQSRTEIAARQLLHTGWIPLDYTRLVRPDPSRRPRLQRDPALPGRQLDLEIGCKAAVPALADSRAQHRCAGQHRRGPRARITPTLP